MKTEELISGMVDELIYYTGILESLNCLMGKERYDCEKVIKLVKEGEKYLKRRKIEK